MMIVLVLAADVTALMTIEPGAAGDGDGAGGEGRAKETSVAAEAIQTTTAPLVLAVEDFSPGSTFEVENGAHRTITGGELRLRDGGTIDRYLSFPPEDPRLTAVGAVLDVGVSISARRVTEADRQWFGVTCRMQGLDADGYVGAVEGDGSWRIIRVTFGTGGAIPYVKRELLRGPPEPEALAAAARGDMLRVRLECTGDAPAVLRLFLNEREVGQTTDKEGLGPGNAGWAGRPSEGELAFDDLLVVALG